jgi:hypothetical protein
MNADAVPNRIRGGFRRGALKPFGYHALMTTSEWLLAANVAAVLVAGITIIVAVRGVGDQLRMSTFLAYTERYSTIMKDMPFEARQWGGHYLFVDHAGERDLVLRVFRDYLNMCYEEKWLVDEKRIDKKLWGNWTDSIKDSMRFPCFPEAWQVLRPEYVNFDVFVEFIDELYAEI